MKRIISIILVLVILFSISCFAENNYFVEGTFKNNVKYWETYFAIYNTNKEYSITFMYVEKNQKLYMLTSKDFLNNCFTIKTNINSQNVYLYGLDLIIKFNNDERYQIPIDTIWLSNDISVSNNGICFDCGINNESYATYNIIKAFKDGGTIFIINDQNYSIIHEYKINQFINLPF